MAEWQRRPEGLVKQRQADQSGLRLGQRHKGKIEIATLEFLECPHRRFLAQVKSKLGVSPPQVRQDMGKR